MELHSLGGMCLSLGVNEGRALFFILFSLQKNGFFCMKENNDMFLVRKDYEMQNGFVVETFIVVATAAAAFMGFWKSFSTSFTVYAAYMCDHNLMVVTIQ